MQVDKDGKGSLTPEAITLFLDDLGLEPTSSDVKLIMQEMDPRQEVPLRFSSVPSFAIEASPETV